MITRERVDANSFLWPDGTVPYAQFGPWPRPDCSGYVGGLCWAIPAPVSTVTLVTDGWMHEIAMADALPGDALGKCGPGTAGNDGHIQLFRGWTGEVGGALRIAEQAGGPPGPSHHTIKRPTPGYKFYRFRDIADGPVRPPSNKGDDMIRLIEKDGRQYIVMANALSETGFAWVDVTEKVQPLVRVLTEAWGGGMSNTADARTNQFGTAGWTASAFGPSAAEVRAEFMAQTVAAVVAALPAGGGGGGSGPSLAQITAAVRAELDKTKLAGV